MEQRAVQQNEDMTAYLQGMVDCAKEGDTVLLPGGTVCVSRPIVIREKKNLKIVGQDTHFLHTGYDMMAREAQSSTSLFILETCRDVTLENFSVDYAGYVSIAGTVEEIGTEEKSYFILHLYPEFKGLTGKEYYRAAMSFDPDGAPNYHLSTYNDHDVVEKIDEEHLKVYCKHLR